MAIAQRVVSGRLVPGAVLVALACGAGVALAAPAPIPSADLVMVHGKFLTMDPQGSIAEAVAVRDGRIVGTGRESQVRRLAGPGARIVDMQGRTVLPGFIDAHAHPQVAIRVKSYLNGPQVFSRQAAAGRAPGAHAAPAAAARGP
jgi:imidazolonepropionase-like amidohydrolase